MENLKHTKGEWEISKEPFCLLVTHKLNDSTESICQISQRYKSDEEQLANAKLISASKDLLEALIEMYKSCKPQKFGVDLLETDLTSVGSITMPSEQAVLKMCNAINKATK
jgi:hypothetical protein